MPIVSVVVPAYNRAVTLSRTIDSVLDQTFDDFELILVDDASTDSTEDIVDSYDDERIKYLRHDENRGANAARNSGIKLAEGEYISFLDSDDEFHPKHLERAISRLVGSEEYCGGIYTSFEKSDNGLTDISVASKDLYTPNDISDGNIIGTFSCTTFKKSVFDAIGSLDEDLPASQDIDFYIRVLKSYSIVGISEVLVTKHQTENSIGKDIHRKQRGFRQLRKKHGDVLSRRYKSNQYRVEGKLHAMEGNTDQARHLLRKSINIHPRNLLSYYFLAMSLFGKRAFATSLSFAKNIRMKLKKLRYRDLIK